MENSEHRYQACTSPTSYLNWKSLQSPTSYMIIANLSPRHHYGFTLLLLSDMNSHIYMFHADKDIGPRILSRDTMAWWTLCSRNNQWTSKISGVTIGAFQLVCSSFVGMGDIITKEVLDWLLAFPELLNCFPTFARLSNDIASTEVFL